MSKWATTDIPNQTGRTVVVTGSNTGLGFETAKALAAKGAHVVLAVRNLDKGREAASDIVYEIPSAAVSLQHLDLASLTSVRRAAEEINSTYPRIDVLVNNAGVMYPPKELTADGFELQLAANHLGHFAFSGLLLDNITSVPGSRIVTVSSMAHRMRAAIHFDDLQFERNYDRVKAYGQSKLANLMFTYELQRRLAAAGRQTIAAAAHPGGSKTALTRHVSAQLMSFLSALITQSAAQGALPILRAATDPDVLGGQYFGPSGFGQFSGHPKLVRSSALSHDADKQRRLWAVSEELTGVEYPI